MHKSTFHTLKLQQHEQPTTQHSFQFTEELPLPSAIFLQQKTPFDLPSCLSRILTRKTTNQQRFCLQILKQFLLFPDSSLTSSIQSVSVTRYDPLLFSDEKLHSLLKILETQRQYRRIWAFINLKMHRKLSKIKQGLAFLQGTQRRLVKKYTLEIIRQHSIQSKKQNRLAQHTLYDFTLYQQSHSDGTASNTKLEVTAAGSERQIYQRRQERSIYERRQERQIYQMRQESQMGYGSCCCQSMCCCCQGDLWERIQYLRWLEEAVAEKEKRGYY